MRSGRVMRHSSIAVGGRCAALRFGKVADDSPGAKGFPKTACMPSDRCGRRVYDRGGEFIFRSRLVAGGTGGTIARME
jgi:hypothetical protein